VTLDLFASLASHCQYFEPTPQKIPHSLTAQIARDLDRDYEAVLDFVHEVQDVSGDIDEFELSEVCEADEIYVTAGEKGREDEDSSPRERGLKTRDAETSRETNHQF
jgi:hypothetical protein